MLPFENDFFLKNRLDCRWFPWQAHHASSLAFWSAFLIRSKEVLQPVCLVLLITLGLSYLWQGKIANMVLIILVVAVQKKKKKYLPKYLFCIPVKYSWVSPKPGSVNVKVIHSILWWEKFEFFWSNPTPSDVMQGSVTARIMVNSSKARAGTQILRELSFHQSVMTAHLPLGSHMKNKIIFE